MSLEQFDELKKCTRCDSDACYSREVGKNKRFEYCYGCGFTHSFIYSNKKFFNEQLDVLPEIYKILADEDENGKIWIPSFTKTEKGLVYANGIDREDWCWELAFIEDDKINMKGIQKFNKDKGFMDALDALGVFEKENQTL